MVTGEKVKTTGKRPCPFADSDPVRRRKAWIEWVMEDMGLLRPDNNWPPTFVQAVRNHIDRCIAEKNAHTDRPTLTMGELRMTLWGFADGYLRGVGFLRH